MAKNMMSLPVRGGSVSGGGGNKMNCGKAKGSLSAQHTGRTKLGSK